MTTRPTSRLSVAALAGCLLAATLTGCGDDATEPTSASDTPSDSPQPEKSPSDTATSTPSEPSGAGEGSGSTTVPAYFVGETPQGPRLFREFRKVEGDPLEAAAALVTSGDAADGDYRTLYPGGGFASVEFAGGSFQVELADSSWEVPAEGMTSGDAKLAVQQLVRTLQGVQQDRAPVEVLLNGTPTSLFGVDTSGGVGEADPIETLALVNVTSPEEGATVRGSFTASGVASSFEANVPWEIRDGDSVVASGFATAEGWMDKLYPWEAEVDVTDLAPGTYQFVAMTDDPSGGAEGAGPTEDSKTITVE